MMKCLKGFRTILFNLIPLLVLVCDFLLGGDLVNLMIQDPKQAAIIIGLINILNICLRFITTTAPMKGNIKE